MEMISVTDYVKRINNVGTLDTLNGGGAHV